MRPWQAPPQGYRPTRRVLIHSARKRHAMKNRTSARSMARHRGLSTSRRHVDIRPRSVSVLRSAFCTCCKSRYVAFVVVPSLQNGCVRTGNHPSEPCRSWRSPQACDFGFSIHPRRGVKTAPPNVVFMIGSRLLFGREIQTQCGSVAETSLFTARCQALFSCSRFCPVGRFILPSPHPQRRA
jgi:hypothetical protein